MKKYVLIFMLIGCCENNQPEKEDIEQEIFNAELDCSVNFDIDRLKVYAKEHKIKKLEEVTQLINWVINDCIVNKIKAKHVN